MVHQNISAIPQHNHLDLSNLTLPAAKKGNETAEGQIIDVRAAHLHPRLFLLHLNVPFNKNPCSNVPGAGR